jgi:hypothetical protein
MNAIATIIPAGAPATTQEEWVERGRTLADQRREVDWALGDWMAEGKEAGYLTQSGFDFLSENLGLTPKRLKDALKAATTFPPALRDRTLSVDHYAAVASLPQDEALPLLKRASTDHLPVNALREHVTQRRYETGANFEEDDLDSTMATLMFREWNRSTPEARELAFERMRIAASKGFKMIDEDEAEDD